MSDLPQKKESSWEGLHEVSTMAWPVMLGAMSFVLMDFVDKVFVSKLGVDHLAAVGSAGIWSYTLGVFFIGIAGCVSTFASQSIGKGNPENASRYTWQGIYVSMAAGVVALILWPLSTPFFQTMGHTATVTGLEVDYFQIRLLGFIFFAWQTSFNGFFMSIHRPKIPMVVAVVANVSNIFLDYVLIFGKFGFPELGIKGAAVATVASAVLQVILLQGIFLNSAFHKEFKTRTTFNLDWVKFKELFRIGWPSGLSQFLDVASWSVFTSFIVGQFGTAQLAANTAAINFMHLSFIPAIALNQAIAPIVGRWIGIGNIAIAKARAYTAMKIGMVIMITIGTTSAIFGATLMKVFSVDPIVIEMGHTLLICAAVFAGFDAINIVISGALRGAGDTKWMMVCMFFGSYFVSLPLAYLFAFKFGFEAKGAWFGATIYIALLSGVFFWRFHGEKWRHINIFASESDIALDPAAIEDPHLGESNAAIEANMPFPD
jgi:MATE family multidrug resistance protein